jgi:membrane peptidoglycan carboxypeptidase
MKLVATFRFITLAIVVAINTSLHSQSPSEKLALALKGTQASGVVLDIQSGRVIAQFGRMPSATPGSVLKPLLLQYALDHNIIRADTQAYCRRDLHIAGRNLACTHPADQPVFTAESALAESCNTWFAAMARRFSNAQLEAAFTEAHLQHTSVLLASVDQRQLAVLGLEAVRTTPLELAQAYRQLLVAAPKDGVVMSGLKESVQYGMANPAAVGGATVLGKTGTASNPGEAWTHGWFAGALPNQFIIVIFVPHGDGGTAARLAKTFIASTGATR